MRKLGTKMAQNGYVLRSGAAAGADQAFELGWWDYAMSQNVDFAAGKWAELYLPWEGFNDHYTSSHDGACYCLPDTHPKMVEANRIASEIHPAWDRVKQGAKRLHSRNIFQVLGKDLATPSNLLICYAQPVGNRGNVKGGTNTAVELALRLGIKVVNLWYDEPRQTAIKWTEETQ